MALSAKRRQFALEYVRCWNASESARRAGYSATTARVTGHRLMRDDEVKQEIARLVSESVMTADEALVRLGEQARATYADYINADGNIDMARLVADGKAHLIKGIKPTRYGDEIQFHDAQAALFLIAKAYGIGGPTGTADDPTVNVTLSLDEWRDEQKRRRAQAAETESLFPNGQS